jgi:hypothetical protein
MFYIRETNEVESAFNEDCVNHKYFEYKPDKDDYLLTYNVSWDEMLTDIYQFRVGMKNLFIPSGIYLFCGDEFGTSDWILSDEIIGRDIPIFTSNIDMTGWKSVIPKLVNTFPETFYYPLSKNPIPVADQTGTITIVTSRVDQYHKLSDRDFGSFFGGVD